MKKILLLCVLSLGMGISTNAQSVIKVGQDAPELLFNNPEGKPISLKKVSEGSYVLLDFWASWCGPCRRANPELVQFYNEFKDRKFKNAPKGFKIFSVSLDTKLESWKKAIKDDNLNWPDHVSDLKSWRSEAAEIYNINYIPQTFLIGPDGKIIGHYNSASEAKEALEKEWKK